MIGRVPIRGPGRDRSLYRQDRKIAVRHTDRRYRRTRPELFVEGRFEGTGEDGSARQGELADHWTFAPDGRVALRRTSLFVGAD
jgi:hypothetical protein